MPTYSASRRAEYFAAVLDGHEKEVHDQVQLPLRYLNNLEKNSPVEYQGGEKHIIKYKFGRHSSATELSTGWEEIQLDFNPTLTPGEEGIVDVVQPAGIAGHEQRLADEAPGSMIKLWKGRVDDAEMHLRTQLQTAAIQGGAGVFSSIVPLDGEANSDGIIENLARGSQDNTIHGISRSDHTTLIKFQNYYGDVNNLFSLNGLDEMYEACIQTQRTVKDMIKDGQKAGNQIWYGSVNGLKWLKKALGTREQYVSQSNMDGGRMQLLFNGIPIELLEDLPTNWTFLLLDHAMVKMMRKKKYYFTKSPVFDLRPHFDVVVQLCQVMVNQICYGAGTSALIDNGETF